MVRLWDKLAHGIRCQHEMSARGAVFVPFLEVSIIIWCKSGNFVVYIDICKVVFTRK